MSKIVPTDNYFFPFLQRHLFFLNGQYFPQKNKKGGKKIYIYRPPATPETVFFLGWPKRTWFHPALIPETLYHRDSALQYIAYVMLIWAAPIPADRWHCSLWP